MKKVAIGSVLYRQGKGLPDNGYNDRVDQFNHLIREKVQNNTGVKFWKHRGVTNPTWDMFEKDGVHLNFFGKGAYACSLKRAIVFCSEY